MKTQNILRLSILLLVATLTFSSCKAQQVSSNKIQTLEGKTIEYDYGEHVFVVEFTPGNKLNWKATKGSMTGMSADEHYQVQRINNYTLYISWIEKDGAGITQLVNLNDMVVNTFSRFGDKLKAAKGKLREL